MNLKEEKQELYNFINELHHNRDYYSRAKLLELVKNKIKETIPNTILSEHNDNIDTNENALPKRKFEIDFDGNVLAGFEIEDNNIKVIGAMNGYGNGISLDKIKISEK